MFSRMLAPSNTTLENREYFQVSLKKYFKEINICWIQIRTEYGVFNINIESGVQESEDQREWVTCVRSQSEFATKSESELSSLKSQPAVLSRLCGRAIAKTITILHAFLWQRLLSVYSTPLPFLTGQSPRLLFLVFLAVRRGHMTELWPKECGQEAYVSRPVL